MAHLARLPLYGLLVVQVLFAGVAQSAEFHELFTAYSRADKGGCQNHLGTGGLFDKWHQEMFDMVAAAVKGFHEYDITPPVQMAARNFLGVPRDPRAIPGTLKPPRGKIYGIFQKVEALLDGQGTYNNAPLPWLFCDSSFLTPKDTTSQAQDSMCNLLTTPNLIPVLIGNEYAKRLTNGKKPFWSEDMCTYVFEPPEHGDNYCAAVEGDKGLAVTLDTLHNDLIPNHPPDVRTAIVLCPLAFTTPESLDELGGLDIESGTELQDIQPKSLTLLHEIFHALWGERYFDAGDNEHYGVAQCIDRASGTKKKRDPQRNPDNLAYFALAMYHLYNADSNGEQWDFSTGQAKRWYP